MARLDEKKVYGRSSICRRHPAACYRAAAALLAVALFAAIAGCGGTPPGYITSLDVTFSDQHVAEQCLADLGRVAEEAARADGTLAFFAYDGDPLSRRGVAVDFAEFDVPNRVEGTSKEDDYRAGLAKAVIGEMRQAASRPPSLGGTPLAAVLIRLARLGRGSEEGSLRAVNCGDGLWTDLAPEMDRAQLKRFADQIPRGLEGMTVDFVGLGASSPGTGRWIERLRPLVAEVLVAKGARLGVYDIELPADWPPEK